MHTWLSSWLEVSQLEFQRLVISCFQVAIWLKYRWSDINPEYNQPTISMHADPLTIGCFCTSRCVVKNSSAVIEIEFERAVCLELYKDYKDLGRFMLRSSGSTIAAGLVEEVRFLFRYWNFSAFIMMFSL